MKPDEKIIVRRCKDKEENFVLSRGFETFLLFLLFLFLIPVLFLKMLFARQILFDLILNHKKTIVYVVGYFFIKKH